MADTNAQGLTAAGMGAYAQQRADQAKGEAIAAQSLAGAKMAPQGTVYDVAANNYKDPLTGAVYIGSANTTAQGPGGITQEMKVNPQPGLGGLRFQQGAAGVTPNIPVAPPLPENQKQFIDQRMTLDGTMPGAANPGTVSSATARSEQGALGSEINQTKSSLDTFYQSLMDKLDGRNQQNVDLLKQQQQSAEQGLRSSQAQETNTQRALEYRLGRSDTLYGNSEMQQLAASHRQEIADSNMKYQTAIQNANNALQDGQISLAKEWRAQAIQEQQLAMQKDKMFQETQKFQRDNANDTIEAAAKDPSFTPPQEWFDSQDKLFQQSPGFSKNLFNATRNAEEIMNKKNTLALAKDTLQVKQLEEELKNSSFTQLENIEKLRKMKPFGEAFTVGDNTYYGTDSSTIEISKNDGIARMMYLDPKTGQPKVKEIGQMDVSDPAKIENVYVNGHLVQRNKDTKQTIAAIPNGGANGALPCDELYPNGVKGGQCPTYVRNFVDIPGNLWTKQDKANAVNVPKEDGPQPGYALFTKDGAYGHVAYVTWTGVDEKTGKQIMTVSESNWKGDEKVSNGRVVEADNPNILGYGNYPPKAGMSEALGLSDAPKTSQQPQQSFEATDGGALIKSPSPFFPRDSAQTEAQFNASSEKEQSARALADLLISGTSTLKESDKDPISIRAKQIAMDNGWRAAGEASSEPVDFNKFYSTRAAKVKNMSLDPKAVNAEYELYSEAAPAIADALNFAAPNARNSLTFSKAQSAVLDKVAKGDFKAAGEGLQQIVRSVSDVTAKTAFDARIKTQEKLGGIMDDLQKLEAAGVKTNLLVGGSEDVAKKLGTTVSPELRQVATRIAKAVQEYTKEQSGTAFTEKERAAYEALFPKIGADSSFNAANVAGFLRDIEDSQQSFLKATLGETAYDAVYKPIPVIDKATGQEGTIEPYLFDATKYKKI